MADPQQQRSDAQSDSDDECDEPVAGTAFSDYVALEDDAALAVALLGEAAAVHC